MANGRDHGYEAYARRRRAMRRRSGHYGYYGQRKNGGSQRAFPIWAMLLGAVGMVGVIAAVAAGAGALTTYDSYADELVAPDELAINQPSYGAVIKDRHGTVLYEYVDDKAGLRRPTPLEEIHPAFLAATISTEDDSFFTNPGVNFQGLARAAWENSPFGGSLFEGSGGSSITQQLVKSVYIDEEARQERWSQEGVERKVKEMIYALELTERYEKSRILEWYVNQISYGGVFNGVEAASQGYFGKPAKDLTLAEAALLAGIPQSPAAYDPRTQYEAAIERRNAVLDLMLQQSPIQIGEDEFFSVTQAEVDAAKREEIVIAETQFPIEAPHWVLSYIEPQLRELLGCPSRLEMQLEVIAGTRDILKDRPGEGCEALFTEGLVVTTTLDLELQNQTREIMEGWILEFEAQSNTHNGSMMIMDPTTGEILVMIGSRDYNREDIDGKNNNATACNSPGSSFKPFAYLATFEQLGWGPQTIIMDTPVTYTDALGRTFTPTNPLKDFSGPVTIRHALGNSLNIPANKAAAAVGSQAIINEARKVGFVDTFRLDGCSSQGGYGPAIATGGVDVTLEEMMYGYSVLAAGGVMRGQEPTAPHDSDERQADPVSILNIVDNLGQERWKIEDRRRELQVVDAGYTYLLWDIMTDPSSQCATFGCGGITIPGYKAGVKTGTSEPYPADHPTCAGRIGETWAFGFSPDLVVGIWAGNADNSCITNIVSTSIAFRAMRDTFTMAHAGISATAMTRPSNVVEAEICMPSGMKVSEHCKAKVKGLFVEQSLPKEEDTWWKEVEIDIRNGKLASSRTPPQYRERRVMLVLPEEWTRPAEGEDEAAAKKRVEEWVKALGGELAPTEESDGTGDVGGGTAGTPSSNAAIYSPANGRRVDGVVQIIGRATGADFAGFRLEFGEGDDPDDWHPLTELPIQQAGGTIGVWDTRELTPGEYTLRLVVVDDDGDESIATVVVEVESEGRPNDDDDED